MNICGVRGKKKIEILGAAEEGPAEEGGLRGRGSGEHIFAAQLWTHAQIQVHDGKNQVWNRAGEEPAGMNELTIRTRRLFLDVVVWRGDVGLDPSQRRIKVLGSTIGSDEFKDSVVRHGN